MPLIVTWNMQGGQGDGESKWNHLANRINNPRGFNLRESPSIVLLQECSEVPAGRQRTPMVWGPIPGAPIGVSRGSINFGTSNNPKCFFIAHQHWGLGNNRTSFAVLIRTDAFQDPTDPTGRIRLSADLSGGIRTIQPVPGSPIGSRPILGISHGMATYYSIHAPSGETTNNTRIYISGMLNAIAAGGANFVLGGDFNCEPYCLYNPTHPNPVPHATLHNSRQLTYANQEYDYFFSNNNVAAGTALHTVQRNNLASDHRSIDALF
ncbi:MAG: endonuclease/exonuclease/phosphatase family protein [Bacteroidota bacterium]|nr:endonuclease/exonuclease/phosphatase family protein [Bacteroidota bacterium]